MSVCLLVRPSVPLCADWFLGVWHHVDLDVVEKTWYKIFIKHSRAGIAQSVERLPDLTLWAAAWYLPVSYDIMWCKNYEGSYLRIVTISGLILNRQYNYSISFNFVLKGNVWHIIYYICYSQSIKLKSVLTNKTSGYSILVSAL